MKFQKTIMRIPFSINLHPSQLSSLTDSIQKNVHTSLPPCRRDYGYITKINTIEKQGALEIRHTDGRVVVNVVVDIDTILPVVDDIYTARVQGIYGEGGIFLLYKEKIQILIPKTALSDWIFFTDRVVRSVGANSERSEGTKDLDVISVGDSVDVEITAVQYAHKNYQCLARLVENEEEKSEN